MENVTQQIKKSTFDLNSNKKGILEEIFHSDPKFSKRPMLPNSLNEATYVYDASSPRFLSTPGHFAYVKISEGCDLPCTFCIIPKIRGHFRSRSIENIELEVQNLANQGVREVCLVAQDSTWYGADLLWKAKDC